MNVSAISVLLADKHALTSAGFKALVSGRSDMRIVAEVKSPGDLPELLKLHQPTIFVVDYAIDGFVTSVDLQQVKQFSPSTEILIISSTQDKNKILDVLQLGINGYLTKECSQEEILSAIDAVARGEKFYCHKILNVIMEKHFTQNDVSEISSVITAREREVLTLLAKGKSTQQIASHLYLSPHTIHTHRKSIIKKLNIKSPTEFVIHAMDLGLIKTN